MATFEQLRHAAEMCAYCEEMDLGHGYSKSWDLKHFQLIEEALDDGENVFVAFMAINAGSSNQNSGYCAYAVTSNRIIMAQKRLMGQFSQMILLNHINDITYSAWALKASITIETPREKFKLKVRGGYGKKIYACLMHGLDMARVYHNPGAQASQGAVVQSLSDELMKLKQLVDSGILTRDEFDAKKKQILGI